MWSRRLEAVLLRKLGNDKEQHDIIQNDIVSVHYIVQECQPRAAAYSIESITTTTSSVVWSNSQWWWRDSSLAFLPPCFGQVTLNTTESVN